MSLRIHWLLCHQQAVASGFHHFAAGIAAAYPLTFGEAWPEAERPAVAHWQTLPVSTVRDYLKSKPEGGQ